MMLSVWTWRREPKPIFLDRLPIALVERALAHHGIEAAIARHYPDAAELYAARGWALPDHIDRVYDPTHAAGVLGFRPSLDLSTVLAALRSGADLPFIHDPAYSSPQEKQRSAIGL